MNFKLTRFWRQYVLRAGQKVTVLLDYNEKN